MGRIEEIKERFDKGHYHTVVEDALWMLSRLQIAEETLKKISYADDSSLIEYPRAMVVIADKALEQIRQ